jgi:hypothetical protein
VFANFNGLVFALVPRCKREWDRAFRWLSTFAAQIEIHLTEESIRFKQSLDLTPGYQEMPVKTSAMHRNTTEYTDNRVENFNGMENPERRFSPRSVNGPGFGVASALRMYTEEEVSGILQVSLSQLRKWRMKEQAGKQQGPPFKKVGRLVRYPQRALQAYIDGD